MTKANYCICPAKTYCQEYLENSVRLIILKIDDNLIDRLKKALESLKNVADFFESPSMINFYDCSPKFISPESFNDEDEDRYFDIFDQLEDQENIFVETLPFNSGEMIESNVECVRLCVDSSYSNELYWKGYVKHTDIIFATNAINIDELKQASNAIR